MAFVQNVMEETWQAKTKFNIGEAVGIIAAQSIGEPGTQLTMNNKHFSGAVVASDITKGLPRVEEIFEARKPKGEAQISEISGVVTVKEEPKSFLINVRGTDNEADYEIKNQHILRLKAEIKLKLEHLLWKVQSTQQIFLERRA